MLEKLVFNRKIRLNLVPNLTNLGNQHKTTMELFHGTNDQIADDLSKDLIDINLGSGEFGKGFYTGDLKYHALAWAHNKYGTNKALVTFNISDTDFENLDPKLLNEKEAIEYRLLIKKLGQTKTYEFGANSVWGPVVGRKYENYSQVKFESITSQNLLNSSIVTKTISKI